jgi:sortase A
MWTFHKSPSGKDRAQTRTALMWIEWILVALGLVLLTFYVAVRLESWLSSRAALKGFEAAELAERDRRTDAAEPIADKENELSGRSLELPDVDFTLWDAERARAHQQGAEKQSAVPLAVLRIPRIHLEAPIFDGTDSITLNHALGRIAGTANVGEPGNIGIAGHRDGFFRGLKDVAVGDLIELKTMNGTVEYVVDQIQIVSPHQVDVLRPRSVPSLTLVTCYPFYFFGSAPQRYIVTASLSQEKNGGPEVSDLSMLAATSNAPVANPTTRNSTSSDSTSGSTTSNSTRRKHMKLFKKASLFRNGAGAIVLALLSLGTAAAQDSTVTTIEHGMPNFDTQVKNAEIVYVEGNDLVLKLENGRVEHLVVPDSDRFTIDGKEVGVHDLVLGTKLTQTITTTTTPRYVNSVRTIEGKVWHVNAPQRIILTLPNNNNQVFDVPSHAKFTIDGKEKTVFDLKKGMTIKATIVTDEEHTVIEQSKFAFGQAPQVNTPREVGVLLFAMPSQPHVTVASAEEPEMLPETGSPLPWIGLLGTLAIAASVSVGIARRRYAL